MREAAGVIADRASSEDGAESRRATAWVVAEPSARLLLDDDRRDDVLALGGASAAQDPETFLDILLVKAAALAVRGDPGRRPAFLDAIAHALARPRPAAPANIPPNQPGQPFWEPGPSARPFDPDEHATVFWMAGPSADEVADHPEVIDATLRIMSLDRRFSRVYADRSSSAESRVEVEVRQFIQAEHRGTISGRDAPWLMLRAIADDPSILDLAADRLDAEEWRRLLEAQGPWDELKSACLDPKLRPALSANRSESAPLAVLEAIERLTEDQEEPRNRALAVLSYFVRGASPGSEARNRFEGIVEAMLGDPREDRQGFGKLLGRSLAPTDSGPGGATAPGEDAPPPDPALRR
jgi:hypothetical protein